MVVPSSRKPLDAPGVDELVHLLGPGTDLGVPLAAVDDLDPQLHGQAVEGLGPGQVIQFFGLDALDPALLQQPGGDVQQPLLGPVGDEARVGPVFHHGGGAGRAPAGRHAPNVHVPPIKRQFGRMFGPGRVGVPKLHGGIQVQHPVVVAPLQDFAAVDVPGQVHQQVPGAQVAAQEVPQVPRGDPVLDEGDPLPGPFMDCLAPILEIHHRNLRRRHLQVLEQERQGAGSHRATAQHEDSMFAFGHLMRSFPVQFPGNPADFKQL